MLNGIPANGTWTLKAVDSAGADTGSITAWSLILTVQSGWACTDCTPATPTARRSAQIWTSKTEQQWEPIATATEYHLYRGVAGDLAKLLTADPDSCLRLTVAGTSTGPVLSEAPGTGGLYWYLVRAANGAGEGPAGNATAGARNQSSTGACP